MRRAAFLALLVSLLALPPAWAGTRTCNATLVAQNVCRASTGEVVYCLPISTVDPDGAGALVAPSALILDAFAASALWTGTIRCENGTGNGTVGAGICTAGQLGQIVPITRAQNADLQVRNYIRSIVRAYQIQQAVVTAESAARATADPDFGN